MKILYEIKIVIFKYVENPISLALANRAWYTIFHDPHARSEWLLNKYGRAHALFHAVRLGRNFLTLDVIKCLMAKKAILSRYFVQRLMLQCGGCDGRLLELRNTLNKYAITLEITSTINSEVRNMGLQNIKSNCYSTSGSFWVVLVRKNGTFILFVKTSKRCSMKYLSYDYNDPFDHNIYYCCDAYNIFGCYEGRANLVGLILDTSIFYIVDWCLALKDYCRLQQFIAQNEVMKVLLILKL
uniref:Uncharacterized protein n=1 Tax=Rhizophagus irregularis (strain DAOM 181602 / DAOM 197198 / MUCL 43194) TaxID=747089 RepID=U9UQK5_RHIID